MRSKKPAPLAKRSPNQMVNKLPPGETIEQATAAMMVEGLCMNVLASVGYSKNLGVVHLTESRAALTAQTRKVRAGDLGDLEALLAAQAITLNAMFTQMAILASKMTLVDQIERFTRLAFKAQGQCRTTIETLATVKNPPTVFARQANFAHGPQQINNGSAPASSDVSTAEGSARAENHRTVPNKLLTEGKADGERLDTGKARASGTGNKAMATVGAIHRPENTRG